MIYLLWKADGTGEDIVTKKPLSIGKMQKLVGGYVEMVRDVKPYNHCFAVNEDGLPMGLPVNNKFPQFVGNVIEGLMVEGKDDYEFVGF